MKLDYTITPEAMTIQYLMTAKSLKEGALIHYRKKILYKFLILLIAFSFIPVSVIISPDSILDLIPFFIILGVFAFCHQFLFAWRASKATFKGKDKELPHLVTTGETGLNFETPQGSSATNWNLYVDVCVHPNGILLYPQKNLFYWIPATATITDGTWQEFTQLLEAKIEKKI
ncbi:MAG: hypothetical protein ACI9FG_001981 [Crocinitomicaceae bacterium]|jgi:hypothetical protein